MVLQWLGGGKRTGPGRHGGLQGCGPEAQALHSHQWKGSHGVAGRSETTRTPEVNTEADSRDPQDEASHSWRYKGHTQVGSQAEPHGAGETSGPQGVRFPKQTQKARPCARVATAVVPGPPLPTGGPTREWWGREGWPRPAGTLRGRSETGAHGADGHVDAQEGDKEELLTAKAGATHGTRRMLATLGTCRRKGRLLLTAELQLANTGKGDRPSATGVTAADKSCGQQCAQCAERNRFTRSLRLFQDTHTPQRETPRLTADGPHQTSRSRHLGHQEQKAPPHACGLLPKNHHHRPGLGPLTTLLTDTAQKLSARRQGTGGPPQPGRTAASRHRHGC